MESWQARIIRKTHRKTIRIIETVADYEKELGLTGLFNFVSDNFYTISDGLCIL